MQRPESGKIDLVYTWVDGNWPGHLEEMGRWSAHPVDMNPERWRDTFEFLRYSLRSAEKFLPFLGRIHIVTKRPQVPAWLDVSHPKIRIVHHDAFMPPEILPTFNSNAIESCIAEVPDLSEHFIYMNDDFLFSDTNRIEDYFRDGKYTVFNTFRGENLKWRVYFQKNGIVGLGYIEHGPHFARRDFWRAMMDLLPDEVARTRGNRFRQDDDLVTFKLYRRYMLEKQRALSAPMSSRDYRKFFSYQRLDNDLKLMRKRLAKLRELKPKGFNLNDNLGPDPDPRIIRLVQEFLAETYPEPSSFERADALPPPRS